MSLTQGGGPLGRSTAATNYTIESPAHKILFEPDARRLRAYVGDTLVLDTRRAHLLHETATSLASPTFVAATPRSGMSPDGVMWPRSKPERR